MHLAELNIARLKYPFDDPRVAEFADNLDLVNGIAERSPGFVWRLQDETGNATDIRGFRRSDGHRQYERVARCREPRAFRLEHAAQALLPEARRNGFR